MFMQHHNDKIIKTDARRKTQEDFFTKIYTSHFIARVRKGCSRFACERELEIEHNCNILTPLLWPSRFVFLVLLMLNRRPRGSLCCVMAFFIASYQRLPRTSAHQGPRPLRPGVAFPITSRLDWNWNSLAGTQFLPGRRTQLEPELNSTGSSNSTQLYNRSTPTRSLKSNV